MNALAALLQNAKEKAKAADTVGPICHNHAALLRRPAAATPAPASAVLSRPARAREDGGKGRGAGRIPCPPPVAIGPSSLLPGAAGFVPYVAGLDKLLVSFWLEGAGFDEFRRTLRDFKEEFNDEKLCGPDVTERAFDLGWEGVSFNMSRFGAKSYPYKLQSGDIVLLFSNHRSTASQPNCRIEIHSMSCWNPGWEAVLDRFLELLAHLGATVRKEAITEDHVTVDLLDVDFAKTGLISHRRWLTKAPKKISETYEFYNPNYISFGKGDFMARCYDKTAELKHDDVKRDFFYNVWYERAGYVPEHVTRIEFQIRRAVSKELQINTVEDLKNNLDAIWHYCVHDWCRFCDRKLTAKDRRNKHQSRYATAFLWEFVRSVSFSQSPKPPVRLERVKPPPQVNMELLGKAGTGCILSICAALFMDPDDYNGHIAEAFTIVKEQIMSNYKKNRTEYIRRIETKRNHAHNSLFQ
ncbi:MAG: hypothetical protein ACTFAK_11125 [Candidatus Electronema sp. VV]